MRSSCARPLMGGSRSSLPRSVDCEDQLRDDAFSQWHRDGRGRRRLRLMVRGSFVSDDSGVPGGLNGDGAHCRARPTAVRPGPSECRAAWCRTAPRPRAPLRRSPRRTQGDLGAVRTGRPMRSVAEIVVRDADLTTGLVRGRCFATPTWPSRRCEARHSVENRDD